MAFLTDRRRELLTGEYDGSDSARRNMVTNLRKDSRAALSDLTEVAESDEIDTSEVIDPIALAELVDAVFGEIEPLAEADDPDAHHERYRYQDRVYDQLDDVLRDHRWRLRDRDRDRFGVVEPDE